LSDLRESKEEAEYVFLKTSFENPKCLSSDVWGIRFIFIPLINYPRWHGSHFTKFTRARYDLE
jgi:hypothetical protein